MQGTAQMQLQARSEASNHAVCGELSYVAYLYFSRMHYSIVGCVRDLVYHKVKMELRIPREGILTRKIVQWS